MKTLTSCHRCFQLFILLQLPIQNLQASPVITPLEEYQNIQSTNNLKSKSQKGIKKSTSNILKKETLGEVQVEPIKSSEDAVDILYPDKIGENISTAVVGLANRLDSFFGEERGDDEKNGSTLRLIPTYTIIDHQKPTFEMGMNINLKLKNLERKAKNLEKKIREGVLESTKKINHSTDDKKSDKQFENIENEDDWHYNFESKLAARPAIYYSGKLRIRKNFPNSIFLHHFSFSAGWDTDDYWSQKTSFFSDHAINEQILFRFANESNWFISKKTFQTNHGPSIIQTINQYNSISYNFRIVFGMEKNNFHHFDSAYSINYRHGTPSKRMFIDLIPTYSYPRTGNYHEVRSFETRLEYLFGDVN